MLHLPANRYQAFAIHLGISALIFAVLATWLYVYWFPGPFMQMGGWHGMQLLAGVDVVLGPVLTLLIYNRAKKSIRFDLAVIGMLQIGCLSAGLWVVSQERPLAQILVDDKVVVYSAGDLIVHNIDKELIDELPGRYPKAIYVELPDDPIAKEVLSVTSLITKERSLVDRDDLYRPLSNIDSVVDWFKDNDFDGLNSCYWVNVSNVHFSGLACLSLKNGLVALKKA